MTNFKIGDVVYDEVNFPNQKGVVKQLLTDSKIKVYFDDIYIYTQSELKYLSFTPYTIEFLGFSQERPKTLTDEQKICIKGDGTAEYGKKIIQHLVGLGGKNTHTLDGSSDRCYLIDDELCISGCGEIPQGYKEISLKEVEQKNYVGKKIVIEDSTCMIIRQDLERIYYINKEKEVDYIYNWKTKHYKIID